MTQALCVEDGSLPQGLMVQNTYTELCSSSKNVAVVVRNSMAYPQTQEEDPSGKGSCSHMGTIAPCADWLDRGVRRGPQSSNAQVDYEAKEREIV